MTDTSNICCSLCISEAATSVCCCDTRGVVLCHACIPKHSSKTIAAVHILLPIKAMPFLSQSYPENLKTRIQKKDQGHIELLKNIKQIETCEFEFVRKCEECIGEILKYKDYSTQRLAHIKARLLEEIEKGVTEVEENIYQEDYKPTSCFGRILGEYSYSAAPIYEYRIEENFKLPVFLFDTYPYPETTQMSNNKLAMVDKNTLLLFLCDENKWERWGFPDANLGDQRTSLVWLPNEQLLWCGGQEPVVSSAYICDVPNFSTKTIEDMNSMRKYHGILHRDDFVYVFGGEDDRNYHLTSEKLVLSTGKWEKMQNMEQPVTHTNPCLLGQFIYLCGGNLNQRTFQVFDIAFEIFKALPIQTPEYFFDTTTFMVSSILHVIQKNTLSQLASCRQSEMLPFNFSGGVDSWYGTMNPVLLSGSLYLLSYKGRINKLVLSECTASSIFIS